MRFSHVYRCHPVTQTATSTGKQWEGHYEQAEERYGIAATQLGPATAASVTSQEHCPMKLAFATAAEPCALRNAADCRSCSINIRINRAEGILLPVQWC